MKKKILMLTKSGEYYSLQLDKSIINSLKIDEKTELQLSISNHSLTIKPIKKKKVTAPKKTKKNILATAKRVMKTHEKVLKKLART